MRRAQKNRSPSSRRARIASRARVAFAVDARARARVSDVAIDVTTSEIQMFLSHDSSMCPSSIDRSIDRPTTVVERRREASRGRFTRYQYVEFMTQSVCDFQTNTRPTTSRARSIRSIRFDSIRFERRRLSTTTGDVASHAIESHRLSLKFFHSRPCAPSIGTRRRYRLFVDRARVRSRRDAIARARATPRARRYRAMSLARTRRCLLIQCP